MSELGFVTNKQLGATIVGYRRGKLRDVLLLSQTIDFIVDTVSTRPEFKKYYGQFRADMIENARFLALRSMHSHIDENQQPFSYIYTIVYNSFVADIRYRRSHPTVNLDNDQWSDLINYQIEPKLPTRYCEMNLHDFGRCERLVDQADELLKNKLTKPTKKRLHEVFVEFYNIADWYFSIEDYHQKLRRYLRDGVDGRKFYEDATATMKKIFYRKIRADRSVV